MRRAIAALAIEHRGSKTAETVTSAWDRGTGTTGGRDLAADCNWPTRRCRSQDRGRNRVELLDEADHTLLTTGIPNIT